MSEQQKRKADKSGYYYSQDLTQIVEAAEGEALPDALNWEYIGGCEMTPADAVMVLQEKYPDVSVELTFKSL